MPAAQDSAPRRILEVSATIRFDADDEQARDSAQWRVDQLRESAHRLGFSTYQHEAEELDVPS